MEEPQKIKALTEEQEMIQSRIITTIHEMEDLKQHQKFLEKRLKINNEELEFYKSQNR